MASRWWKIWIRPVIWGNHGNWVYKVFGWSMFDFQAIEVIRVIEVILDTLKFPVINHRYFKGNWGNHGNRAFKVDNRQSHD